MQHYTQERTQYNNMQQGYDDVPIEEKIRNLRPENTVEHRESYEVPVYNDDFNNYQRKNRKAKSHRVNYNNEDFHGQRQYDGRLYEQVPSFNRNVQGNNYQNYGYNTDNQYHEYTSSNNTKNYYTQHLEDENSKLKKQLHELRKMEAGWFGKNKNVVKKEVIVKNNHYLDEKEKITTEVTNLREKHTAILRERDELIQRIKYLEDQLARANGDRNTWIQDKQMNEEQLLLLNRKLSDLQRERDEIKLQKPKEVMVTNTTELTEFRRRNQNLENDLNLRNNEINRLQGQVRDLESTILNLRQEINNKQIVNIQQDNTDFDSIINTYKRKIDQLNSQLSEKQQAIDSLQTNYQSHRQSNVKTVVHSGNDAHLKQEISILNQRINDLKLENDKYQTMLKSAKNTEKVIVKEYHDNQPYGMSAREVEDLALRNVALELELKKMLDQNKSYVGQTGQSSYVKRVINTTDNVPVRQVSQYRLN